VGVASAEAGAEAVQAKEWTDAERQARRESPNARQGVFVSMSDRKMASLIAGPERRVAVAMPAGWLMRPVRRPSRKPTVCYHNVRYRAGSWDQARRVVVKIAWHAGELFPRVGCIVTNLKWRAKEVVRFSNGRGTAEQWSMRARTR
jgi:hypothetical protein